MVSSEELQNVVATLEEAERVGSEALAAADASTDRCSKWVAFELCSGVADPADVVVCCYSVNSTQQDVSDAVQAGQTVVSAWKELKGVEDRVQAVGTGGVGVQYHSSVVAVAQEATAAAKEALAAGVSKCSLEQARADAGALQSAVNAAQVKRCCNTEGSLV